MRKLKNILFLTSILLFLAFNFQGNVSGWYQQFLPNINRRQIADMTFIDSLTGYIVTTRLASPDTSYILKTTDGGDSWNINYTATGFIFKRVHFINSNTGFVAGSSMLKTTNVGLNWFSINIPTPAEDISILNEDTLRYVYSEGLTGGVFRTTNGGANWTQPGSVGGQNPEKIYMFNSRIGYITHTTIRYIKKTTNGGLNWTQIVTNDYFNDIYFSDSLTGWKCSVFGMKKTTDGGASWVTQAIPSGGYINNNAVFTFSNINKDTIWAAGGNLLYPNNRVKGILYRTTNGGTNWTYQIPDTSMNIGSYYFIQFLNQRNGWAYPTNRGIHTTVGGDTTFITSVKQISSEIPNNFKLHQNYPNPFNPTTTINYELKITNYVTLKVFDINGKEISTLISQRQSPGIYEYTFDGSNLTSGIYFYSLSIDNKIVETKKMMLVK